MKLWVEKKHNTILAIKNVDLEIIEKSLLLPILSLFLSSVLHLSTFIYLSILLSTIYLPCYVLRNGTFDIFLLASTRASHLFPHPLFSSSRAWKYMKGRRLTRKQNKAVDSKMRRTIYLLATSRRTRTITVL